MTGRELEISNPVHVHNNCGGRVFWDMSGGFCQRCEEEELDQHEDTTAMSAEDIDWQAATGHD